MSDFHYTIRNYQPSDFNKFVQLNVEAEKLEPAGSPVSEQLIAEHLGRPNYSPGQDLFLIEIDGSTVGYLDMAPELTIGRVILYCWIHPEHHRKGLATKLLGYALKRARELAVKVVRVKITKDNTAAKKLLSKLGFKYVHRFLELRLDLSSFCALDTTLLALECRHLMPGEEEKLTGLQNRCFAGTWGFNPNTVEEITYRLNQSGCSPQSVVLTCQQDNVIGYCWTELAGQEEEDDRRTGRISMMGTDPDYRGKGVGKRVIMAGLKYLKDRNARVAELTVDSENRPARALYRSLGFKVKTTSLWYEKMID
ncbi:MAG: GNAT family N-acetyltransferase [Dehalococcoidales bacterium]|nr:GNAT family N-acetyltransferase [Dehalococcoidales bacterium]